MCVIYKIILCNRKLCKKKGEVTKTLAIRNRFLLQTNSFLLLSSLQLLFQNTTIASPNCSINLRNSDSLVALTDLIV